MTIINQYLNLIARAVVRVVKFILLNLSHIFDILYMISIKHHSILSLFPLSFKLQRPGLYLKLILLTIIPLKQLAINCEFVF